MEPQPPPKHMIGNVPIWGDRGRPNIAEAFVERLGELPPTKRRLALALACALPWRNNSDELPNCYKRELEAAAWEAYEEDLSRGQDHNRGDIEGLIDPEDPPISKLFLRQLVAVGPTERRAVLAQACIGFWIVDHVPPPKWLSRYCDHAYGDDAEDYRLRKGEHADG